MAGVQQDHPLESALNARLREQEAAKRDLSGAPDVGGGGLGTHAGANAVAKLRGAAIACAALWGLVGCTTLAPHHQELRVEGTHIDCRTDDGAVPTACSSQIVEIGDGYRLHFAEFDDQGRPYPELPTYGHAPKQVGAFLQIVQDRVSGSDSDPGVSVVVFAHGWLHSAAFDDGNLKSFRRLLGQLAKVESSALCRREVIGLYVGWRGAGTVFAGHPTDTLTFWSRKLAAENVASGSFQQVIGGLKAIQSMTPTRKSIARGPDDPDCSSRIKTTYVGHSFGGLAVLSSMSQDLIRGLMLDRERLSSGRALARRERTPSDDELVIAINPAIEGARLDALLRVARDMRYETYRTPRLVIITSRDDWATGTTFPIGRTFNTITKKYPKGDTSGRQAARIAVGHDPQYQTRELITSSQYTHETGLSVATAACNEWHSVADYKKRAAIDVVRAKSFYGSVCGEYDANELEAGCGKVEHWPRLFCASRANDSKDPADTGILVMRDFGDKPFDRNVPIWNVYTRSPILDSHGDIENVRLLEFLRQLYVDSMFFR